MTRPDGIDQSFGYADPSAARAAGIRVVMMYLSHTPAKNATAAKIKAYHAVGIGVLLGWETMANRALGGTPAGASDGAEAAQQYLELIRQVGYAPKNTPAIAFAVDFDTNSGEYVRLDAYFRATKAALAGRFLNGVYGEADLLDHLASAHLSEMEFGTYAWSWGRISGYDDFHQFLNGQKLGGADVDFDKIVHPTQVGAWWPPNSQYDTDTLEDDMTPDQFVALLKNPAVVRQLRVALGMTDAKGGGHGMTGLLSRIRRGDWVAYFDDKGKPVK